METLKRQRKIKYHKKLIYINTMRLVMLDFGETIMRHPKQKKKKEQLVLQGAKLGN